MALITSTEKEPILFITLIKRSAMLHYYKSQTGKKNYLKLLLSVIPFFVLLFFGAYKTAAQNYVVNTTADTHAAVPGAGTGVDGSGNISLRSAIEDANARPAGTLHTHNITFSTTGTISLSLGQIVVGTGGFTIQTTALGGATQAGTTATITTTSNHNFVVGQQVAVYGVVANGYNGIFTITAVPTANTFSYTTVGGLPASGQNSSGSRASSVWEFNITGPGAMVPPYSAPQITISQTTAATRMFFVSSASIHFKARNLSFINGNSPGAGAAISAGGGSYATLINCNFTNNIGGNCFSQSSSLNPHDLIVDACTFTGNSATAAGGALNYNGLGVVSITNSTFVSNSAGSSGGAINTTGGGNGGTYLIEKCTFLSNTATGTAQGGAISNGNGQLTVRYCRFINNTAADPTLGNVIWQTGGNAAATITANNNWWGVNVGPVANDIANGPAPVTPPVASKWLQLKHTANPASVNVSPPGATTLTASFLSNSVNEAIAVGNLSTLIGLPITFNNAIKGVISSPQTNIQATATATAIYTVNATACPPPGSADAIVDNATATASIIIVDNIPPTITCSGPAIVSCTSEAAPNIASVTATDNCPPVTVTWVGDVITNQTCANRYTITRTYRATDAAGNTADCTQMITVNDQTAPALTCPAPATVSCASAVPAPNTAAVTGVSDNCGGTITVSHVGDVISNQTCANRYTITRTYRATDVCGNSTECTQIITVNDQTPPTFTCPAPITVSCASAVPAPNTAAVTGVSDNCGGTITVIFVGDVITNQTCANRFTITRTYRATDVCGNTAECTQLITVNDQTAPTLTCPAPITVSCAGAVPAPNTAAVTGVGDNCGGTITVIFVSDVISNQTCTNRFTITRTYRATDVCGNIAECTQLITVNDQTPPTLTCPAPITVSCASAVPAPNTSTVTGISDNCGGLITVIYVGNVISNQTAVNRFTITRTYRATDACGNTAECTQTITVNDQTAPQITCPANITVIESPAGSGTAIVNFSVTATDVCDGGITPVSVPASGSAFPIGETMVTSTATDASGNSINCSFKVTVQPACQITCPANTTVNTLPSEIQCGTIVTYPVATTTGNCGTLTYSKPSGSFFDVGETIVTVSSASTGQSCTFKVTVVDKTKPTIICPPPVNVKCASLVPATIFTGIAFDNCSVVNDDEEEPLVAINVQFVSDVISNQTCANRYIITRTYMATDQSGNTSTCSQTITVNDDVAPALIGLPVASVVNVSCAANVPVATFVTATDNCGTLPVIYTEIKSDDLCANKFKLTRTWTATDACGNSTSFVQTITVNDVTAPSLTCPSTVTVNCASLVPSPNVTSITGVSDNCSGAVIVSYVGDVISNQTCANKYTITRTYKATDVCGNSATCTQTIIVNDNLAPVPPVFAQVLLEYDCIADVPTAPAVNATDNCDGNVPGVLVVTDNGGTGCVSSPLIITRTWTFTDQCGNSSTAVQTVRVVDDVAPAITGETVNPTCLWPPNHKMRDVYVGYTAADNCKVTTTLSVSSNEPINGTGDGDTSPDWIIGTDGHSLQLRAERAGTGSGRIYTITITATDGCNTTTKTVTVSVAHDIASPISGSSYKIGSTVNFTGTFWDKPGNKHTASWLIDGTSVAGTVTAEPNGLKNGSVTGAYKFNNAGVYKLQMNVKDQTGVVSYANTRGDLEAIVVIYDPNGGYAYGGGYFNSPAGSLKSNATATGKVSYGFNSNYFKGATNPKGETQMQFQVGNLEFNALNFDYLAISGAKAQFKGSGKITGDQAGYNFIMTVIDGALNGTGIDKMRLKIYNKNSGAIIYDNQAGASDAADPTTIVASGSTIVIFNNATVPTTLTTKDPVNIVRIVPTDKLEVNVIPNPTETEFMLQARSNNHTEKLNIRIVNIHGQLLKVMKGGVNETFRFGSNFKSGTYFAEVIQGTNRQMVKLIKLN